jgi:D-psicose/D-tagatose/L-ribulose 3-epimerase
MKLGLINSAWFGSPVGTAEGIRLTKRIGFDSIDISADPMEIDVKERKLIKDTVWETGLPVISVVGCSLGIADFNLSVRRFHIERSKQYLDLGYELEAKNYLIVVGEYVWQQEVIPPREQWKWAVEGLRELGEYAQTLGLEIAVELEPFHLSIVNDVPSMLRFLDDVGHPAVKANLDVSHLALVHAQPAEVAKLKGRIAHAHFSDCDGKKHGDLPPGRGVVDFPPYLAAMREARFTGTVSIELEFAPDPARIVDWVTEAYLATDRLMQAQGLRESRPAAAVSR